MKFLKKASDVFEQTSLTYLLHNHLSTDDPHRGLDRVHASSVTGSDTRAFCPREYAIHDIEKSELPSGAISTSEQVTFRIGRDVQDAVVEWFSEMDKMRGDWVCQGCGHMRHFTERPEACSMCHSTNWRPEEMRFKSSISGVSCGVDMVAKLNEPKLRVVEIKTMAPDQFKKLVAPLGEHKLRTNMYLRLVDEANDIRSAKINTEEATILYVSKGGYGVKNDKLAKMGLFDYFSPFKEFTIQRDDKATDSYLARAQVVEDYRQSKVGIPCGICATALTKRAVACTKRKACFSGKYEGTHKWQK